MQNIDQVFLYMKEEIEKQAKSEEEKILFEVQAIEDEAYATMKEEAKRDAELRLKQEEQEIRSQTSSEISESYIERTKKLIQKRDEYVKTIFDEAKDELISFTKSKDYLSFMKAKVEKVACHFESDGSVIYIASKDLDLKDEMIQSFGKDIQIEVSDDIVIGGFIIENKMLSLVEDETLDFALNNQREWFNQNSGLMIK